MPGLLSVSWKSWWFSGLPGGLRDSPAGPDPSLPGATGASISENLPPENANFCLPELARGWPRGCPHLVLPPLQGSINPRKCKQSVSLWGRTLGTLPQKSHHVPPTWYNRTYFQILKSKKWSEGEGSLRRGRVVFPHGDYLRTSEIRLYLHLLHQKEQTAFAPVCIFSVKRIFVTLNLCNPTIPIKHIRYR